MQKFLSSVIAWILVSCFIAPCASGAVEYKIVTASERGTYIQIGRDLAKFVAPEADIQLDVLASKGSADNLNRLRYEANVKLAIVQSDVYQAFLDFASAGNAEATRLIRPLRVVTPLYNEEIYFIVRADSPLQYVHEIKDKKMNVDRLQSGTALSATTLYRLMFGQPIPEGNATFLSNEEGLVKLTTEKTLDVVVVVAGQPAKLLADMKPEAKQLIRLLKVDPNNPATRAALQTYFPATIRSASYPNWLDEDVPGLAIKALLVTYDYSYKPTADHMIGFARSLCKNLPILQTEGHPKWRDVELTMPDLGAGWEYYAPVVNILRNCNTATARPAVTTTPAKTPAAVCTQSEKILGLCPGQ
ncbi:MAG: TAXI family TRAP transporter solute-binding subunit [Burkholderiaceae bacterium]